MKRPASLHVSPPCRSGRFSQKHDAQSAARRQNLEQDLERPACFNSLVVGMNE